jgi:hypothetical protein
MSREPCERWRSRQLLDVDLPVSNGLRRQQMTQAV